VEARPFRFGVSVRRAESGADWREKARRAEAYGYSTFLVPDHPGDMLPPLAALASAAEATEGLRVGTFVLNNDLRHPVLVAREAAALDFLSDGRFELGLGAGYRESDYEELGLRFDAARVRIERLGEAVGIVKALLEGETVTFAGAHYRVSGHTIHPLPVQRPRPPVLVGGNSRRLLALAAREADCVSFLGFSWRGSGRGWDFGAATDAGAAERVAFVREAAGRRFGELELNAVVQRVVVTDTAREAAEELAREWPLGAEEILGSPHALIGSVDGIAGELREKRERHGFSYWAVFEPELEAFAPVVARLAGT
jgi:probable F420-dependent oxidoreductase